MVRTPKQRIQAKIFAEKIKIARAQLSIKNANRKIKRLKSRRKK